GLEECVAGAKAQGLVFCSLNPMSGPGASDDLGLRGGEAARSVRRLQPGQIRGAAVVSQLRTTAAAMAAVPCWRRWSGGGEGAADLWFCAVGGVDGGRPPLKVYQHV